MGGAELLLHEPLALRNTFRQPKKKATSQEQL